MLVFQILKKFIASINFDSLPNLSETAPEDIGWLTLGLFLVSIISIRILFFQENWALKVQRKNHSFQHLIIPSECLKVYRDVGIRPTRSQNTVLSFTQQRWPTYKFLIPGRTRIKAIIAPPKLKNWRPLLVFANTKSGGGLGRRVLEECEDILHPLQVHDLSISPPHETLKILNALPDQIFSILICGGDGTVNWIFAALDVLQPKHDPMIAVLPLGTGNDLSRVLGWGSGYGRFECARSILSALKYAEPVCIDRWKLKINDISTPSRFSPSLTKKPNKPKILAFQNYFSIGCDASVALDFHTTRAYDPIGIFQLSRRLNKFFYTAIGAKHILNIGNHCHNLGKRLEIELDGKPINIPNDIEGIVFLNVWSWGGGCPVWRQGLYPGEADCIGSGTGEMLDYGSMCDGKIEVLAFKGTFHMAQIQVNLADPIRLGQAETIRVCVSGKVPMQADGEPWMNDKCVVEMQATTSRTVLRNRIDELVRNTHRNKFDARNRLSSTTSLDSISSDLSFFNLPQSSSTTDITAQGDASNINTNTMCSAPIVRNRFTNPRCRVTPIAERENEQQVWEIASDQ